MLLQRRWGLESLPPPSHTHTKNSQSCCWQHFKNVDFFAYQFQIFLRVDKIGFAFSNILFSVRKIKLGSPLHTKKLTRFVSERLSHWLQNYISKVDKRVMASEVIKFMILEVTWDKKRHDVIVNKVINILGTLILHVWNPNVSTTKSFDRKAAS